MMRSLAWDQRWMWEGCGIDRELGGSCSISMGPSRLHDNVLCLRVLTCLLRNDVCRRCVRRAIWGASVEKSCAPAQRSCRLIPISGSSPVEPLAMEITEESCYGD